MQLLFSDDVLVLSDFNQNVGLLFTSRIIDEIKLCTTFAKMVLTQTLEQDSRKEGYRKK